MKVKVEIIYPQPPVIITNSRPQYNGLVISAKELVEQGADLSVIIRLKEGGVNLREIEFNCYDCD